MVNTNRLSDLAKNEAYLLRSGSVIQKQLQLLLDEWSRFKPKGIIDFCVRDSETERDRGVKEMLTEILEALGMFAVFIIALWCLNQTLIFLMRLL